MSQAFNGTIAIFNSPVLSPSQPAGPSEAKSSFAFLTPTRLSLGAPLDFEMASRQEKQQNLEGAFCD
jgi:hypothetical protein